MFDVVVVVGLFWLCCVWWVCVVCRLLCWRCVRVWGVVWSEIFVWVGVLCEWVLCVVCLFLLF